MIFGMKYIKNKYKKYISKPIRNKIRRWLNIDVIAETLQLQSDEIKKQTILIAEIINVLKERTEYHLDIHSRKDINSQVILIGKYKSRDFIKCYTIPDQTFIDLIQHCRSLNKYATKGIIDTTPEISACIDNKLSEFDIDF